MSADILNIMVVLQITEGCFIFHGGLKKIFLKSYFARVIY